MRLPKITRLPSGAYHARIQIDGRRVSVTADSFNECEREILSLKLNTANMGDLCDLTLHDAIELYITARKNVLSPSTVRGYNAIKNNRFQAVMFRRLSTIKNWQAIVNSEARLVSAKTLKNAWGLVSAVLSENGIDCSPIRLPMVIPPEKAFLQPEQIKKFVAAIQGDRYEILFLLCLHGLRRSEAIAVEKADISDVIRVNKARVVGADHRFVTKSFTKNVTSTRTVPVFIDRLKKLAAKQGDGVLVRCDPHWATSHLKEICAENGLPEVTLHGLRHSFASLCYHLNIPELQCMELGGWSDLTTMRKIYTHIADEDRKKATAALRAFAAV